VTVYPINRQCHRRRWMFAKAGETACKFLQYKNLRENPIVTTN